MSENNLDLARRVAAATMPPSGDYETCLKAGSAMANCGMREDEIDRWFAKLGSAYLPGQAYKKAGKWLRDPGPGWLVTYALGQGVDVRGRRHTDDDFARPQTANRRPGRNRWPKAPSAAAIPAPLPATPTSGAPVSVADIVALRRWFPARGKKGWWTMRDGQIYEWRHIVGAARLPDGADPVRAAARGCAVLDDNERRVVVPPHTDYDGVVRLLRRCDDPDGVRPALALGGSVGMPYPFPLLAVDCDYHPESDADGSGRLFRDLLRSRLADTGALICPSRSGEGYHALLVLSDTDTACPMHDGVAWSSRKKWTPPGVQGIAFDINLPGAPMLLALRLGASPLPPAAVLPVLGLSEIDDLMVRALRDSSGVAGLATRPAGYAPAPCGWPACRRDDTGACARRPGFCPE